MSREGFKMVEGLNELEVTAFALNIDCRLMKL